MMNCEIRLSDDGHYIILKIVGEINRELNMKYNLEAHAMGDELGISSYLVDLIESINMETVLSNYEFAYKDMMQEPDIDKSARVAMLVRPDDHSHDFIETLSQNAGYRTTIFRDEKAAIDYLLSFPNKKTD